MLLFQQPTPERRANRERGDDDDVCDDFRQRIHHVDGDAYDGHVCDDVRRHCFVDAPFLKRLLLALLTNRRFSVRRHSSSSPSSVSSSSRGCSCESDVCDDGDVSSRRSMVTTVVVRRLQPVE